MNVISAVSVLPTRRVPDLIQDARAGLVSAPRTMPPKYFYDERGSQLFDAICNTPEYYPTRTEVMLLERHAADIIAAVQPDHIVESGSATSRKTRYLLDACDRAGKQITYWPFDVCDAVSLESGCALMQAYDWLKVRPLVGDYHAGIDKLRIPQGTCLYLFLGGTIGNFEADAATGFLQEIRALMCPGDYFLLGADRVKDADILHAGGFSMARHYEADGQFYSLVLSTPMAG